MVKNRTSGCNAQKHRQMLLTGVSRDLKCTSRCSKPLQKLANPCFDHYCCDDAPVLQKRKLAAKVIYNQTRVYTRGGHSNWSCTHNCDRGKLFDRPKRALTV